MYSSRNSSDDGGEHKKADVRREYISSVKFTNTLPDVPQPPKFITRQKNLSKFIDYTNNHFIKRQKRSILCGYDVGVHVECIDPIVYGGAKGDDAAKSEMHFKDLLLLDDEYHRFKEKTRSETHATPVSCMKNSIRPAKRLSIAASSGRIETKIGYNLEKKGEMQLCQSREKQIEAIQKTFEDVKKPCREHYSKKGVYAVEELPILPDFKFIGQDLVQADFSSYPELPELPEALKEEALKLSQIVNTGDACGHFIPTVKTIGKLFDARTKKYGEEDYKTEYQYKLDREYTYVLKRSPDEYYFRIIPGEAVVYGPLEENKVVLSRVRNPAERKQNFTMLHVKHRLQTNEEVAEVTEKMERLLAKKRKEVPKEEESAKKNVEMKLAKKAKDYVIAGQRYEEIEEFSSSESSDLSSVSSSSDEYEPSKHNRSISDEEDADDLPRHLKMKIKKEPESYSSSD